MHCSTPADGAGTSVSTLSVETSSSGSSAWTCSPSFFSQRMTVPSETLSPSSDRRSRALRIANPVPVTDRAAMALPAA